MGLLLAFMVFYTLLHVFTWAMPRYRLPVDAAGLPFAGLALSAILARIRLPRPRPAMRAGVEGEP